MTASDQFARDGFDIYSDLQISVFDAILGGTFPVKTFWGQVDLTVPANTRDGQLLRIRGKGVQSDGRVGDHIVRIEYQMPKKLGSKEKELLEQLRDSL